MFTRNFTAYNTNGKGNLSYSSKATMENQPRQYTWMKNTSNKWFNTDTDNDDYIRIGTTNGHYFEYKGYQDITSQYCRKSNDDIDDTTTQPASTYVTSCVLFIGDGNTQPTYNDYCLEHCLTDYVRNREGVNADTRGDGGVREIFMNITANSRLEIKEIGCYMALKPSNSGYAITNLRGLSLIARKVLNTPIIVEAGENATIYYNLDFRHLSDSVEY